MTEKQGDNRVMGSLRMFFRDTSHWVFMGISGFLLILSFFVIWYGIGNREAAIVLHYNVYFGVDVIGEWWQAYFIPLLGTGIWMIHLILAFRFFQIGKRDVCQITFFSLLFLEGMILVASFALGLVNY